MSAFDRTQWRLGHRRAWWNWNLLTLFVASFLLIWMREWFDLSFQRSLLMFVALVGVWLYLPDLRMLLRELFAR